MVMSSLLTKKWEGFSNLKTTAWVNMTRFWTLDIQKKKKKKGYRVSAVCVLSFDKFYLYAKIF